MKCEKVQKEAAKKEKFVPNAVSSYVPQSYTHSLSLHLPPCCLSLLLLSLLGRPPSPSTPLPPAPCFSPPSSALAVCQKRCYGRTRHWGLKLSTDVDRDKGRRSTKPKSERGGRSSLCPGRSTHILPEEPSATVRCQVPLYTQQCDGGEMLFVWVYTVLTRSTWATFPLTKTCLIHHIKKTGNRG